MDTEKTEALTKEFGGIDFYDIAGGLSTAFPALGGAPGMLLAGLGITERVETQLGMGKGYNASEKDFSINLPGRATAQQKAVMSEVVAEQNAAARELRQSAQALKESASNLSESSKPTAHPGIMRFFF